jgi:hypothetical protein
MINSIFNNFPEEQQLLSAKVDIAKNILQVNGHFHTPYSFSAFSNINQIFEMADRENIKVLGINDFCTNDGYEEFNNLANKFRIFPLFNIEFMALQKDLQSKGIKVNDPDNPGRTYFSGKGLKYPVDPKTDLDDRLVSLQNESNRQTGQMIDKLNTWIEDMSGDIVFSFKSIKEKYAKNLLRERHIAKAVREAVEAKFRGDKDQKEFYKKLFGGKEVKSKISDFAELENEIRVNLLKSGGEAFVPEDDNAFLNLEQIIEMIINAGGIPCYPVLLDNTKGEFTDFEKDYNELYHKLVDLNVYSLELIPGRNKPDIIEEFVNFFNEKGFVITFGTEHNTPKLDPINVRCGNGNELNDNLKKICYEGACIIAAHQYLIAKGKVGFLQKNRKAKLEERDYFIDLGNAVINYFVNQGTGETHKKLF